jgi:23S rRNA pseudouridine2605 synthase
VEVDGKTLAARPAEPVVILLHKPAGYDTTVRDPHAERTVMELVAEEDRRLYPVGRLDRETTGVLLLTDDGELAHRLTHPSRGVEKVYLVRARGELGPKELERLASGVDLDDGRTAPARIEDVRIDGDRVRFLLAIHEGRKRQVRRMVKAVGGRVTVLTRVSFAGIVLGNLPEGGYRVLKPHEVRALRRSVGLAPPVRRRGKKAEE